MGEARQSVFSGVRAKFDLPFVGITRDGQLQRGLFTIGDDGLDTERIFATALDLLDTLSADERHEVMFPIDAAEWRQWTNAYPIWPAHGLLLEDLSITQRESVVALLAASLSVRGLQETRDCMRLNAVLGEVVQDYPDTLTEWMYRFSLFGVPSRDRPWGWQIVGHHLNLHCFILARQMVFTPTFMGAEPRVADRGEFSGIRLFDAEMARGLELMNALDHGQRQTATLCSSMLSADLPPELNHPTEGRMRSVVGGDNLMLAYEGVCAADLTADQRRLLTAVIEAYVGRLPDAQASVRMKEIEQHFGETYFAWVGPASDVDQPFYYKVHSPVALIEFDCHSGVFLANEEPEPFHVHTVVRTPNGNDYGRDLLRQHYEQAGAAHGHRKAQG